jgi:outer membrane protein assembly factor BamC
MMKAPLKLIIIGITVSAAEGCSYLESMFPDKERDYQYTAEIPMINLPPELRRNQPSGESSELQYGNSSLSKGASETNGAGVNPDSSAPPSQAAGASGSPSSTTDPLTNPETSSTEVTPADDSDERDDVSSVEIVKYDDGESRLRLGARHSRSWRVVNKALSHNTIEVTERNPGQSQIKVQYDPDEQKAKDGSFMDEIGFIFHGIGIDDREYVLKLEEHGDKTDVIVLDSDFLPMLNDNGALRLLKVMADTIKADVAKKAKAESSQ